MNKEELIAEVLAKNPDLKSKAQAYRVVNTMLETIKAEVAKGGSVGIVGFGTFGTSGRNSRICRNPKTGNEVTVAAHKTVKFKAGKAFKAAVNS